MKTPDPNILTGSFRLNPSTVVDAALLREGLAEVIRAFSDQADIRERALNWSHFRAWPEGGAICFSVPMV